MYNSVIIGSSPFGILEALYRHSKGESVLIIDQGASLGGAWGTVSFGGYNNLEIGCHIWDVDDKVFRFLFDYLNLSLEVVKPGPQIIYKNIKMPYEWKNNVYYLQRLYAALKGANRGNKSQFNQNYGNLVLLPKQFHYPRGGAGELLKLLKKKLPNQGIDIQLGSKVTSLFVNQETKSGSLLLNQKKIEFEQVVIMNFSEIKEIKTLNETYALPEIPKRRYIHVHLLVESQKAKPFSYIRVMGHEVIHRISDASSQLIYDGHNMGNKKMILVGVHEAAYDTMKEEECIQAIMSFAKKQGLIASQVKLLDHCWNVFPTYNIPQERRKEILDKFGEVIKHINSANFTYGIAKELYRWRQLAR